MALAAIATSLWRVQTGHHFLPGLFTVVFLPVGLCSWVLDLWVKFSITEWVAVTTLVIVHLTFSVPAFPGLAGGEA